MVGDGGLGVVNMVQIAAEEGRVLVLSDGEDLTTRW